MTVDLTANPYALNELMEFDRVIAVRNGEVTYPEGIYAPELHDGALDGAGWTLMVGYSGAYSYSGPIMNAAEFIGGGMARDILATDGLYVALVDYPHDDTEPDGWAVAYRPFGEGQA